MSIRLPLLLLVVVLAACSSGGDDDGVEVGFLQDMYDHHEQAVRMALLVLDGDDTSPITRRFAVDVIASQRYEMGLMVAGLDARHEERGRPGREVMAWMEMATPFADMPGLATQDELDALATATGATADEQFLRLMIEHHEGGLHMAEWVASRTEDDELRDLADQIVSSQTKEIGEMELAQDQLGFSRP